jgi:hypothetical protein
MRALILFGLLLSVNCENVSQQPDHFKITTNPHLTSYQKNSWRYFLQHLPVINAPVLDYTGKPISNQTKHVAIINYDIGSSDLQQCADALMRIRAEYLFEQKRFNEIGFHFCSGQYYSWSMYCTGIKPVTKSHGVIFISTGNSYQQTHESLRHYLNIVYAYANTISLCKELKPAADFETGTVIITPGSPGHTCIIIGDTINDKGEKLYKLAEGYMPAQSIYILSNPFDKTINPWYRLSKGEIITASYDFTNYQLKKFE